MISDLRKATQELWQLLTECLPSWLLRLVFWSLLRVLHRVRTQGTEQIPTFLEVQVRALRGDAA